MDADERESLAGEVDALALALEEERARHLAGLEPEPALARLFEARPAGWSRETAARLRALGDDGTARLALALSAERAAAAHEEGWRAAEGAATVAGPDGPLPLVEAELAIPREPDRTRRLALARAVEAALEPAARHREAAAEARARARAEAGLVPDWGAVVEGDQLLAACDDAWRDLLAFAAGRDLGLAPAPRGDLRRADLLRLLDFPALDGLLGGPALRGAVRAAAADLGLDLSRVRIAEAERAAWPGAHAAGGRVVFRARGGLADWPELLDALGLALHAARHAPGGRDPVFGAALGALLAGLCLEPRWLAARLDLSRREAPGVLRAMGLRRMLALRAGAAALRVATEVARGLSGLAWREAHREALGAALGAAWEGARASRDAEAPPLAAAQRGFAEGERLREGLRERFDEDWWRNPRAREHLAALLAAGRLPEGEPASAPRAAAALARLLERGRA